MNDLCKNLSIGKYWYDMVWYDMVWHGMHKKEGIANERLVMEEMKSSFSFQMKKINYL